MVRNSHQAGRYKECPPDITGTGAGKNYDGFRIFHTRKSGLIEHILADGSIRPASTEERERFVTDLTAASHKDDKVRGYLDKFRGLRLEGYKPEPELTPSAGGTEARQEAEGQGGQPRTGTPQA